MEYKANIDNNGKSAANPTQTHTGMPGEYSQHKEIQTTTDISSGPQK